MGWIRPSIMWQTIQHGTRHAWIQCLRRKPCHIASCPVWIIVNIKTNGQTIGPVQAAGPNRSVAQDLTAGSMRLLSIAKESTIEGNAKRLNPSPDPLRNTTAKFPTNHPGPGRLFFFFFSPSGPVHRARLQSFTMHIPIKEEGAKL